MAYLRAAIATTLLLVVGLLIFIFVSFDTDYEHKTALDYFLKDDYKKTRSILEKLKPTLVKAQYLLDQAYLARAEKHLIQSNQWLQEALHHSEDKKSALYLEILLNQALNGYLEQNADAIQDALTHAKTQGLGHSPWILFFSGEVEFLNERYLTALSNWARPFPAHYLSPWMQKTFGSVFTPRWLSLNLARCEIELGRFVQARAYLEDQLESLSGADLNDVYLLIGISYVKEAQEKSAENAVPYYKMAFSYFNRLPIQQERYERERLHILESLENQALSLINSHEFSLLPFFITIFENWHARSKLAILSQRLIALLQESGTNIYAPQQQALLNLLNRSIPEGELRDLIRQHFEHQILQDVLTGDFSQLRGHLTAEKMFSSSTSFIPYALAAEIMTLFWEQILLDQAHLPLSYDYIHIWGTLVTDRNMRQAFARQLQIFAEELMERGAHESKAINLIRLSHALDN